MAGLIVMTGATSGFGAVAAEKLLADGHPSVVIGARDIVAASAKFGDGATILPLDLEQISSVRSFCDALPDAPVNVLAMNAGINARRLETTEDGFDRTFQANFLSHFLMFQLLQSRLAAGARVITTGSGTHDPEEKTPVPSPKHADVHRLAHPKTDPELDRMGARAAGRAYTASKLCCILMAMEIAARFPQKNAVSFDPGFLPQTNLSREYPSALAAIAKRIIPYTMPRDRTGTVESSAVAYAGLVNGDIVPETNGGYVAMRGGTPKTVKSSELSKTNGLPAKVWEESLALLEGQF